MTMVTFVLMMTLVLTMMIETCVGYDDDNHLYFYSFYSSNLLCILVYFSFHLTTILSLLVHLCIWLLICPLFICLLFIYCNSFLNFHFLYCMYLSTYKTFKVIDKDLILGGLCKYDSSHYWCCSLIICCRSSENLYPSCYRHIHILIQNRIARATLVLGTKLCLVTE